MSSATIIYTRLKRLCGDDSLALKLSKEFKLLSTGVRKKYNNMKVSYKGDVYDSLSEAYASYILNDMLKKKQIKKIERQIKYPLLNMDGKKTMRYVADFVVTGNSGEEYILDIKGRLTADNKIKYAYFTYVYNKKIHLVFTSGADKFKLDFIK
tara:strand:+ start:23852 stop:24310 length:459 start_codon:yes stop_codon:yes gene_type:complete